MIMYINMLTGSSKAVQDYWVGEGACAAARKAAHQREEEPQAAPQPGQVQGNIQRGPPQSEEVPTACQGQAGMRICRLGLSKCSKD